MLIPWHRLVSKAMIVGTSDILLLIVLRCISVILQRLATVYFFTWTSQIWEGIAITEASYWSELKAKDGMGSIANGHRGDGVEDTPASYVALRRQH
jgi:hypothetical protein